VQGTGQILEPARRAKSGTRGPDLDGEEPQRGALMHESGARIYLGDRIRSQSTDHHEITRVRERVRQAIAELCR
jgi:hypothetical protein